MVVSIIWFELATVSYLYYLQSTCYQAVLKSQIWLKITFSESIWLRMIIKLDKSTFCIFEEFSGVVNRFTAKGFSERSPTKHLKKQMTQSQSFQKCLIYEGHFFFTTFQFHVDTKNTKKIFQKDYGFFDNLIWVGNGKLPLLLWEYS